MEEMKTLTAGGNTYEIVDEKARNALAELPHVDKNGVVHKLDNKFIDAEWMATSEDKTSTTVVIPEQTASTTWSNLQYSLQPGIIYDVYANGVLYPCTAWAAGSAVVLGNHSLMSSSSTLPNNNEPFCIYWAGGTAQMGMFFKDSERLGSPTTIKVMEHSYVEYNQLPEGFLPDGVVRVDTAEVGQTIVVKSVDENGKPTEWEAANLGENWETIAEFAVEESASTIEIDEDLNGENFRLRKAVVIIENVLNGKEGYEDNNLGIRVFIRSKPFDGTYEQMNQGFIRHDVNGSYGNPYIEGSAAKGKYFIAAIEVNDAYWSVIKKIAFSDTAESIYAPNQIGSRIGGISLQTNNNNVNAFGVGTNIRIMGVRA